MTRADVWRRLRPRKVWIPLLLVVVLVVIGAVVAVSRSGRSVTVRSAFLAGTPEAGRPVQLDTSLYLPASTPAPAVLLAQGFGGTKQSLDSQARQLARHGYVVLAYSARGFGRSGGLIHFDSPDYEVRDARLLVDHLAGLSAVDPGRIAVAGSSYGGALALLLAASDKRIKAVGADITWNDLQQALFPNSGASGPGVFKRLWAGTLFGNALTPSVPGLSGSDDSGGSTGSDGTDGSDGSAAVSGCGRFAPDVCAAYQASAATGVPDAALVRLMRAASPSRVLAGITAPTLLTQGEQDSLFPLAQADANARGIAAHGTPVRVVWRPGGHDDPSTGSGVASGALLSWLGTVFGGHVGTTQPFRFAEQDGQVNSDGEVRQQNFRAAHYEPITGGPGLTSKRTLDGGPQRVSAPAGGSPAAITAVPGLGGVLSQFGSITSLTGGLSSVPGQTAAFTSARLAAPLRVVGASTVAIRVTPQSGSTATLFAALRDLAPDGSSTLPSQLVSPLRLTGLTPGRSRTVSVQLPGIVHDFPAGHRIELTVATTDFAYQLPQAPTAYTVALAGPAVTVPTVHATVERVGHPLVWVISGLIAVVLAALVVAFVIRRRRSVGRPDPSLAEVPVSIASLTKEYAGGYRAVDDVSFRVERGQVVGLLGPNGAGKTTTLRVLVGLITPTSGTVHIFGSPLFPGSSVLSRLGTFIEGPGFLPHLSGRQNLELYWQTTGRPVDEADLETALGIAGLGASLERRVRTYSHGMKQRLGIAQAMLGMPELLVLDEPTNGLDPPQIAEMREVLQRYAETGRTVIVSSHLLAEVEQTCTHVVVMHKGRLVASGSVADIAGAGGMQLAVADPSRAAAVLGAAGITATLVPARRALEDVFLGLIGADE